MNRTSTRVLAALFAFSFHLHCGGSENALVSTPDENPPPENIRIAHYESCDALLSDVQANATADMEASMEASRSCNVWAEDDVPATADGAENGADAGDYTDTNLQVAGVDEPDIIKTDGNFIYAIGTDGFFVFSANDPTPLAPVSFYAEPGASNLLLTDAGVVLFSSFSDTDSNRYRLRVSLISVKDPATPTLEKSFALDGEIANSREVDGRIHVGIKSQFFYPAWIAPEIDIDTQYAAACEGDKAAMAELDLAIEMAKQKNAALIATIPLEDYLPHFSTPAIDGSAACGEIAKEIGSTADQLIGLMSLDMQSESYTLTLVKGQADELYASPRAVYLVSLWDWTSGDRTAIHRFSIDETDGETLHQYAGSGSVTGHIENRYALGEYEDALVVTTSTQTPSPTFASQSFLNTLYILDTAKPDLPILGTVENIGSYEKMYATRVIGDMAYVVTYEKIDPLFAISIANPLAPAIQGELEVSGYSEYLHPLDHNHLIGLGKEAVEDESGDFAWYQGLKLSIFDVSGTPRLVTDHTIGDRGSESQALYDAHAFTFDPERGRLYLPVELYEGGQTSVSDYGDYQYGGIHILDVTPDAITPVAEIPLPSGQALRTLAIGEFLYAMDTDTLYAIDMAHQYQIVETAGLEN